MTPLFNTVAEPLAAGHWLLGQDNPGLTDLLSDQPLTPVDGLAPTLGPNFLTTLQEGSGGGLGNGLASTVLDAGDQTLCAVFQHQPDATSKFILTGGWAHSQDSDGQVFWYQGGQSPGYELTTGAAAVAVPTPTGVSAGAWLFASVTSPKAGPGRAAFGVGAPVVAAQASVPSGNRANTFGGSIVQADYPNLAPISLAEVLIFPAVLTPYQLAGVYTRSKARLAARGIAVF